MLMRPNKVETAVQCSVCRMWVFAGFSGRSNLINIYIYIYIYTERERERERERVIHKQTDSLNNNSSVWLDPQDALSWDRSRQTLRQSHI